MKTNAVRALERLKIDYELRNYEFDPDDLAAEKVAMAIGLPPTQVFKTLVVKGDRRGVLLSVIPADEELDFKALARLSGDRSVEMVPLKDVQNLTGYIRGGVTALACKKNYPVFVHESMLGFLQIAVSAGVRGTQIVLAPAAYVRATSAICGQFSRPKGGI